MKAERSSKKRKSSAAQVLLPVVSLLIVLLIAAAMLYLRTAPAESSAPVQTSAPGNPLPSAAAVSGETPPRQDPREPFTLYLDVDSEPEALDVAVCDSAGTAVPGYAFPLEILYQDGSSYTAFTDINGRYYAAYILPGTYTVTMLPLEGFSAAGSVSCTVERRYDKETVEYFGSFAERGEDAAGLSGEQEETVMAIDGLAAALPPDEDGSYRYRYSVGANGCLLFSDGTESDVLPVEERGDLAYGVRMVTEYHLPDGTLVQSAELPEDAVRWTDYYTVEKPVAVPLILGGGEVDESYAITAEKVDPSSERRSGWVEENGRSYYYAADGRPLSGLKNIDGKLYYFDGSGAKASALGIDISYHNSAIDWNAVKAAGVDFAIIRVAYRTWEKGILNEDQDAYRQGKNGGFYLQGAKAAGLKVGVYVYSTAITAEEAVEEANKALEIVRKSGVELDMPIYFDVEFSGVYPKGRADKLNFAQRAEIAEAFCTTVEEGGCRAGVYANEDFFSRALRIQDVSKYEIWLASYTRGFALPNFRGFDLWQFSESIRVNGMPDTVDMNVIF